MERSRVYAVAYAVLSFCATWVPVTVQATPPTSIECTLTAVSAVTTSFRLAGDNVIVTQEIASKFAGGLEGDFIYELRVVQHLSDGTANFEATGTFEGTVDGRYGTAVLEARGTVVGASQNFRWHGGHGTGELAGMHLEGEGTGPASGPLSGWALVHFDP